MVIPFWTIGFKIVCGYRLQARSRDSKYVIVIRPGGCNLFHGFKVLVFIIHNTDLCTSQFRREVDVAGKRSRRLRHLQNFTSDCKFIGGVIGVSVLILILRSAGKQQQKNCKGG